MGKKLFMQYFEKTENLLLCTICNGAWFAANREDLCKQHIYIEHKTATIPQSQPTRSTVEIARKKYRCSACNYVSKDYSTLAEHFWIVHENNRWKCTYCNSELRWASTLIRHLLLRS